MVSRTFRPALCLGLVTLFGCEVDLYRDLSERRVNEAMLLLRESGLHADKRFVERGTNGRPSSFALVVPRSEEARALYLLTQRGLPRLPERTTNATSGKFLLSPIELRSESAAAISAELEATLERLPEIAEARVHLALPDADPFSQSSSLLGATRPTASVLLRVRGALPIKQAEVAELVARAVPGLDSQDVAVVRAQVAAPVGTTPNLPALVSVGPLVLAPESRPVALFLYGLLAVLGVVSLLLLRQAWPRTQKSAERSR